jgi:hypothetical protein
MMKRLLLLLAASAALLPAAPAAAEGTVSIGYAYLKSLEDGGPTWPVGGYLAFAGRESGLGFELDLGYHRDSEPGGTLNTFTATLGPRVNVAGEGFAPFLHLLGGLRYDRFEGESNTAWGGMAGGGLELGSSDGTRLRLGADVQIFWDEGESEKTLRLTAGLTF